MGLIQLVFRLFGYFSRLLTQLGILDQGVFNRELGIFRTSLQHQGDSGNSSRLSALQWTPHDLEKDVQIFPELRHVLTEDPERWGAETIVGLVCNTQSGDHFLHAHLAAESIKL